MYFRCILKGRNCLVLRYTPGMYTPNVYILLIHSIFVATSCHFYFFLFIYIVFFFSTFYLYTFFFFFFPFYFFSPGAAAAASLLSVVSVNVGTQDSLAARLFIFLFILFHAQRPLAFFFPLQFTLFFLFFSFIFSTCREN